MHSKVGKHALLKGIGFVWITAYNEQTGMYHGVYLTEAKEKKEVSFGENEVLQYADEVCRNVIVE